MKKNTLSVIILTVLVVCLAAVAVLWVMVGRYEAQIADLEEQLSGITVEAEASERPADSSIALTAVLRNDGFADVILTGDQQLQDAVLTIMDGETELAQAACTAEGDVYTATAAVIPANGLTYILTQGSETRTLASPAGGDWPLMVNLADSLSAYCNMVPGDWIIIDSQLTLDTCHIQIQTPVLSAAEPPATQEARLILKHRGDPLNVISIVLEPGEGPASYEGSLMDLTMDLPALEEGECVDLWLEAVLEDGQLISTCGGTWTVVSEGWEMSAG